MKKLLLLSSCLLMSAAASADTVLGLYVGGHGWNYDTEGGFANEEAVTNFNYEKQTKGTYYVALEHPVPLIPNIKIRQNDLTNQGMVTLTGEFEFDGEYFDVSSDLLTDIDFSNTDYILYYEIFDNDLISFDVGLNVKDIDGQIYVEDVDNAQINGRESFSGFIPMLYARTQVGFPVGGFGAYAEGSFLSIDGHSLTDYQLALTYDLLDNVAVDLTLELGYRSFQVELEDLDGIYSDLDFNGPYAGLEIHF